MPPDTVYTRRDHCRIVMQQLEVVYTGHVKANFANPFVILSKDSVTNCHIVPLTSSADMV